MSRILSEVNQRETESRSFFARQFAISGTGGQRVFDIFFGIAAPVLCFVADPIVFSSQFGLGGEAVLGRYQLFAYLVSAIAMVALAIWLCFEDYLQPYSFLLGGVFVSSAIFSTIIGLIILPYSLLGVLFVIGLAGFTPFLTAFVYVRNAIRALRGPSQTTLGLKVAGALCAASIMIGLPAIISYQVEVTVSQSIDALLNGDAVHAEAAVNRLRWLPFIPEHSLDSVVLTYGREQDTKKKEILKKYYRDVTGQDVESRLLILND